MSAPEKRAIGAASAALQRRLSEHALAGALVTIAVFAIVQVVHVARGSNGPSPDESLHLVAGLRAFSDNILDNEYVATLSGSLLWPLVGALGFEIGGLTGARIAALIGVVLAIVGIVFGTRRLFGDHAAFFAAIAMSVSAPYLVTAHLALMESIALAGMALCFWSITQLQEEDHRKWVGYASVALAIAMLAQYRAFLFVFPMAALILVLRGDKGKLDIALLGLTFVLPFIVYYQALSDRVVVKIGDIRVLAPHDSVHDFASVDAKRGLILLWGALPILAGLPAWFRSPDKRPLILVLLAGPVIWTLALLTIAELEQSAVYPDLAIGLLLAYPVIGLGLSRLRLGTAERAALGFLAVLIGVIGWVHMDIFDHSWLDSRPATDYLIANMEEDDGLLVNDRWTYALALYDAGIVDSPDDILDEEMLLVSGSQPDLCAFGWFVNGEGALAWSSMVETIVNSCGTFESSYGTESRVSRYGDDLRSESSEIRYAVWENSNPYRGAGT